MLRTLASSSLIAIASALSTASLLAQGSLSGPIKTGEGSLVVTATGTNTYTGGTTVVGGLLQAPAGTASGVTTFNYTGEGNVVPGVAAPGGAPLALQLTPANGVAATGNFTLGTATTSMAAPSTPASQGPAKVFYIITEGAGLGDSVRSVNCTGNETVLDAVAMTNGISQVSDPKTMWIARPDNKGKSAILRIKWDDISKRGINTTNYTLQPGDRLVLGEDSLIKQSNLIAKKTAPVERLMGITSLTVSTVSSLNSTPGGGAVLKDMAQRGSFADDEEVKQFVTRLIQLQEEESKKAGSKTSAEKKPGS
jgi:autotransporter-associated beta strand protein